MTRYFTEKVDRLPHGSAEKTRRYATERYTGGVDLNWYDSDPTLQFQMQSRLGTQAIQWATPHLQRAGALMAGPISELAVQTDKQPAYLQRYDRWGHDVSEVVMPASFIEARRLLVENSFSSPEFTAAAESAEVNPAAMRTAHSYLLDQADIGMACAMGTGGDMVLSLAAQFAPGEAQVRLKEVLHEGSSNGETAQLLTERTGGSDLARLETTARREGDTWLLNGLKWFVSNVIGAAYVVLAKPEGAPDGTSGIAPFLVLRERADGTPNGIRIRRLKDKLGTKSVASAEVELVDAEAFMLAPYDETPGADGGQRSRGLARMMSLTNSSRLGVAMMGLGCARRSLVESLLYSRSREAFGGTLDSQPLMQRKLAELIVEVEAAQALVFDGFLGPQLRIGAPLIKLRAARLGITAASDAIEVHGGNGYIEQWPVARILRDAQVNTVWEGPDNILCLDVRRAMDKKDAHVALYERVRDAISNSGADDDTTGLVAAALTDLEEAVAGSRKLDPVTAEARLFPLTQLMVDVYAGALLVEEAGAAKGTAAADRKALVARLYARSHLATLRPLEKITGPAEEIERWSELRDGALID